MTMEEHEPAARTAEFLGGPMDGEIVAVGWGQVAVQQDDLVLPVQGPGMGPDDFYIRLTPRNQTLRFAHSGVLAGYRQQLDPDAAVWLSDRERNRT